MTLIIALLVLLLPCGVLAEPSPLDRVPSEGGVVRIVRGPSYVTLPTIDAALSVAQPFDVIELGDGTYYGKFVVALRPDLTIRNAAGAHPVVTHADPRFAVPNELWVPVDGTSFFRTTASVGISVYFADGRRVLWAKSRAFMDTAVALKLPAVFKEGTSTLLYLGGADPRSTPLMISASDSPVFLCDRSPRLRLEGLDIRWGGAQGVDIRAGCTGSVLDRLTVYGGRDGIRVKDALSNEITIRRSWIVNYIDQRWFWRDVKGAVQMEGSAILLPGRSHRIENNVIRGWFNGIGTFCAAASCFSDNILIQGNVIDDILDDAIELDGYTDRGEIVANLITNAFVGLSFDPRLVHEERVPTLIFRNSVQVNRAPNFDRDPASPARALTVGRPSFVKLHPSTRDGKPYGPRDLFFFHNTVVGDAEIVKGAPQGSGIAYPVRVRWLNNIFSSRAGPVVRHTGTVAEGNELEGNLYWQTESGKMIENWNVPFGERSSYTSLEAATASAQGQAARWEHVGSQQDPRLAVPGFPSSPLEGSPAIDSGMRLPMGTPDEVTVYGEPDRGAWEHSKGISLFAIEPAAADWVLVEGEDFDSLTRAWVGGLPLKDQVVLSSRIIMGRLPAITRSGAVTVAVEKPGARAMLLEGWTP